MILVVPIAVAYGTSFYLLIYITHYFALLPPATTLTGFHFAVTALVGMVSNATGFSASKHVPLWELLWFSVVANMSITGMNLSLMLNSVGFYQVRHIKWSPSSLLLLTFVVELKWSLLYHDISDFRRHTPCTLLRTN